MNIKRTAIIIMVLGALSIVADVADMFPTKAGAYAIVGAVLIAAGVLVLADN